MGIKRIITEKLVKRGDHCSHIFSRMQLNPWKTEDYTILHKTHRHHA